MSNLPGIFFSKTNGDMAKYNTEDAISARQYKSETIQTLLNWKANNCKLFLHS